MNNRRIFVEKKEKFQIEAKSVLKEINSFLNIAIENIRVLNVYDIFGISDDVLNVAKKTVFSEVATDIVYDELDLNNMTYIATEFLPGQFDQRADSAVQCVSLIDSSAKVKIKSGKLYLFSGDVSSDELEQIKKHLINSVESREKDLSVLEFNEKVDIADVPVYEGFTDMSVEELANFRKDMSLAMSDDDLLHIQKYFKNEELRNPTETEILMLDTYWSDHCRHTTFETVVDKISIPKDRYNKILKDTFEKYINMRNVVHGGKKPVTLMDMATVCGKYQYKTGSLNDLEISDEINACSVYIDVDVNGVDEKWLLMFKNETHNHPTEIEPFGGASTCVGGAIRDPLSGRSYVYQAMRVSGAGNPNRASSDTIQGKLPQKVISKGAARGYSSYGNQIGLATGHVKEIYHEGYVAKHMEVGAVIGAVPAENVRREKPIAGDIVIMFGGRTGRDGIGGATGSSKEHTEEVVENASAEVQKGNAPEERKIQRLFRRPEVTKLVKKSNDFGAGGVSVAIGELADGLNINLNNVLTKYNGLNATELAISESQERMSVVVGKNDVETFINYCKEENIEAVTIATVTDDRRLVMHYNGETIVDLSRDFIDTNGCLQNTTIAVEKIKKEDVFKRDVKGKSTKEKLLNNLQDLNVASQKGLVEMFDSTIGANTVLMPFGGRYQLTETQACVAKIPVLNGETQTASIMTYGYNPYISKWSPFHGAAYAVLDSIAKVVATGASYEKIRFSFQEYFEKLGTDKYKWGKPFAALLGSIYMQEGFGLPAIGGKDSMSGTYKDIHVPPTLISFAVTTAKVIDIISTEFKKEDNFIYLVKHNPTEDLMPNIEQLKANYEFINKEVVNGRIVSAFALQHGGLAEAIMKMSFGNKLGVDIKTRLNLFDMDYGSILVETNEKFDIDNIDEENVIYLGRVTKQSICINEETISHNEAISAWKETFNELYPISEKMENNTVNLPSLLKNREKCNFRYMGELKDRVQVLIPVFPGTNCDYDMARAFEKEGARVTFKVFRNNSSEDIIASIQELSEAIDETNILALAGGFSAGDEPDGSGKFIANILNNEKVKHSINSLLERNGLILGICNGFQALVKSGLLPFGKIGEVTSDSPTLAVNKINRHISTIATTKVISNLSPWLSGFIPGDIHKVAMSHGEGRFTVNLDMAKKMFEDGQVAFAYVDLCGRPTMNGEYNPNGSDYAIEGIVSKCGRILGKMGHSERVSESTYKNIEGNKVQNIFKNAIDYFKK